MLYILYIVYEYGIVLLYISSIVYILCIVYEYSIVFIHCIIFCMKYYISYIVLYMKRKINRNKLPINAAIEMNYKAGSIFLPSLERAIFNSFVPTVAFSQLSSNICCP